MCGTATLSLTNSHSYVVYIERANVWLHSIIHGPWGIFTDLHRLRKYQRKNKNDVESNSTTAATLLLCITVVTTMAPMTNSNPIQSTHSGKEQTEAKREEAKKSENLIISSTGRHLQLINFVSAKFNGNSCSARTLGRFDFVVLSAIICYVCEAYIFEHVRVKCCLFRFSVNESFVAHASSEISLYF